MPTISAGMPVLNGERTIGRAIEDLLAQTFADFEVVVCDNASDDRTCEIAEAYAARDSRVRVIRFEERVGIMESFKRSFDHAEAPYFFFAPADDRWYPTFMAETYDALAADPSLVACTGKVAFIEGGKVSHVSRGTASLLDTQKRNVARYLRDPVENARAFSLIRRQALEGAFPAGEYPGWDFQMTARTFVHGNYLELPRVLSERGVTSLETYIAQADRYFGKHLLRAVPLWRVATEVLRDRRVPKSWAVVRALAGLVATSHANYAAARLPRWSAVITSIVDAVRITDDIPVFRPPRG